MQSTEKTISKHKFLIIAGTNKAGTTSFFEYLAAHPGVDAAILKQTFFFLDKDWQKKLDLASLYDYEKGFQQFDLFFKNDAVNIKLEASPEYLYAPETPQRIADFFCTATGKVIFILRNPVSRFISLFHFGKQLALVDKNCTFSEFIQLSKKYTEQCNTSLMAYETGFYSKYLIKYVQLFGAENIKVYFFENMIANSRAFMQGVCDDLGLEKGFYENFSFETHNKTVTVKDTQLAKSYLRLRSIALRSAYKTGIGAAAANLLRKTITPIYRKINVSEFSEEKIFAKDKVYLEEVYNDEKKNLESLLGINVPW